MKKRVRILNIGLGGASVALNPNADEFIDIEDKRLLLELTFKSGDRLKTHCAVVYKHPHAIGLSFVGVEKSDQHVMWRHICPWIDVHERCLYCGKIRSNDAPQCPYCGWKLDFQTDDYLSYWQKECLYRSITSELKDRSLDDLLRIEKQLKKQTLQEVRDTDPVEEFVGVSPAMLTVFNYIRKVAPTDLPVLILGESGTGKELTARAIFERSHRGEKPFVVINCSAIPASLIESELFGHTKGAFTGAIQAKKGKFEHADQGTIFLDEIGDLPLPLQPKLLRFLEDKTIYRIGANRGTVVDVRIIAATNVDLAAAAQKGQFRQDLYHRIASFLIHLPPLRERDACKEVLAKYFLKKIKMERDWKCKGFTTEALSAINSYSWPGNVRELINRIRRAVVVQDGWIRPADMELHARKDNSRISKLKKADEKIKRQLLLSTLNTCQFNITHTARSLGISRPYVYTLIKKFDIELPRR